MTSYPEVSADDVITPSTCGMIVDYQASNNGEKVFLIDGRHHLKVMQQLYLRARWVGFSNSSCFVPLFKKVRVTISEPEGIELSTLANNVTTFVRNELTFVDFMTSILMFANVFEKE